MSDFDSARLNDYILKEIEEQKIPGLSISFEGPNGTIFEKAYGHRDEEKTPVTTETIMGVASLSKSVTAVALALLEADGRLKFTDPVTRFFPRFKIPGTPKDAVLIKHLLDHTTGLPLLPTLRHSMAAHTKRDPGEKRDMDALPQLLKVETAEDIIDYITAGDYEPLGQPGEYMSYSNDCYAILSAIADLAAGISLEDFLEERVFQPLGMKRSALGFERLADFTNVTDLFSKNEEGEITSSKNWVFAPPYRGCGWIISTSKDMAKYYKMLAQDGVYEGRRILPKSAADRLLGEEYPVLKTSVYGYGLSKIAWQGSVLFNHTGGLKGISSAGIFLKDKGYAGALLSNIGGANAFGILMGAFNILKGLKPETPVHNFKPLKRKPQEPQIYEGYYSGREGGLSRMAYPFKVELVQDSLYLTPPREEKPLKLHFCGGNTFLGAKEGEDPIFMGQIISFFVRRDRAWGLKIGSRIYQRI